MSGTVALSSAAHRLVWLSHGLRGPGHRGLGVAQEGIAQLMAAMPSRPVQPDRSKEEPVAGSERVVIGMDPHKRSVTIEVMTGSSDKPLPGPVTTDPRTPLPTAS